MWVVTWSNSWKKIVVLYCIWLHHMGTITRAQFLWSIREWWTRKNGTPVDLAVLVGWTGGP
jgi:hypothetical protein